MENSFDLTPQELDWSWSNLDLLRMRYISYLQRL